MKTSLIVLLIALFGITEAQQGAYIEYKITSSHNATGSVKINVSDVGSSSVFSMAIPQMPGGGMTFKSLTKKSAPGITYMINDNEKSYSESKTGENAVGDNRKFLVKKLGEETVNGYKCVHAMITEGEESHEVWNTKDIPEFNKYTEALKSNKKIGSAKREEALKQAGCDGMPVKAVHRGAEREGDMTMELVKIEKKNFKSTDFEIPEGYTKTEQGTMGSMPGQMKSQQELMNMTPEQRAKYIEDMKKAYGK